MKLWLILSILLLYGREKYTTITKLAKVLYKSKFKNQNARLQMLSHSECGQAKLSCKAGSGFARQFKNKKLFD